MNEIILCLNDWSLRSQPVASLKPHGLHFVKLQEYDKILGTSIVNQFLMKQNLLGHTIQHVIEDTQTQTT